MNDDLAAMKKWLCNIDNVLPCIPPDIVLDRFLACGGQGVVYAGCVDGIRAAVKIYFPGQVAKRIGREVNALAAIDCPAVVDLLWNGSLSFLDHTLSVVATALVDGISLDALAREPMAETQVYGIVRDLALAVEALWERRIVHRDIKPSNIILSPAGQACLIDLGVARHLDESSLTQMGYTWGSWGYLSPEQAKASRQLTCKSDIFGIGVVAIECGLGRHPTLGDQRRLEASRFHTELPGIMAEWELASLIQAMLEPVAARRPKPRLIVRRISSIGGHDR